MPASSPEAAVDAFLTPLRRTLACIVRGTAIASGARPDRRNTVLHVSEGQDSERPARIRTHGGEGELLFRFAHAYRVVQLPEVSDRNRYAVRTASYRYDILDRDEGEVVVFHWEPEGRGSVRTPHLHLSAAAPIVLPQHPGSRIADRKTHLNRLHLPTGQILVEDVVELLIRDFRAVPLRADWAAVLARSRAAI